MSIYLVICRLTDHNIIYCSVGINVCLNVVEQRSYSVCDYMKVKVSLGSQLQLLPISGNPTEEFRKSHRRIQTAVYSSTIIKNSNTTIKNKITPWINGKLRKLIAYKERLWR